MASEGEGTEMMPDGKERLIQSKYEGSAARLCMATLYACMGAFAFGFTIGYSSPAIPSMKKSGIIPNEESAGWFGSLMTVGAIAGGPFAGYLIEHFGRKKGILFTSIPFIFGWIAIVTASNLMYLNIGRFLTGVASGMVTICVPIYIAEVSTKNMRGVLGSCTQLSITVGISLCYGCGMVLEWKSLAMVGLAVSVLSTGAALLLQETPRWLLTKNRKADALKALAALRDPHSDVADELKEIEDGLTTQEHFSWSEFRKPELMKPLLISMGIMVFQQSSGINAVMFYTVSIFEAAIPTLAHQATVVIGCVQVVVTVIACFLMDRWGRRRLLIIAGITMMLTLFGFGLYYRMLNHNQIADGVAKSVTPIVCLTLYIVGFGLGWGPIPMLVMSEIFPSRARGAASAIAMLTNWSVAFLVTKEFLFMQEAFGASGVFSLFGLSCLLSVYFVWKMLPETKGKSLEEIEHFFVGKAALVTSV